MVDRARERTEASRVRESPVPSGPGDGTRSPGPNGKRADAADALLQDEGAGRGARPAWMRMMGEAAREIWQRGRRFLISVPRRTGGLFHRVGTLPWERVMRIRSRVGRWVSLGLLLSLLGLSLFSLYATLSQTRAVTIPLSLVTYRQTGRLDYEVYLRPNSLFEEEVLGPRDLYFVQLIDTIFFTFDYALTSTPPVQGMDAIYQVDATLGVPDLWEKSFALVPPTPVSGDAFSFSFSLPIPEYVELLETARIETGSNLYAPQLTLRVRVDPQAETPYQYIREPFEQTLALTFDGQTVDVQSDLMASEPGEIAVPYHTSVRGLRLARAASALGVGISGALLYAWGWAYDRAESRRQQAERELAEARKQLQGLLVEVDALPEPQEGQTVMRVRSLSALIGLSEETLRPVICMTNGMGIAYAVVDERGAVRYEYRAASSGIHDAEAHDDLEVPEADHDHETAG